MQNQDVPAQLSKIKPTHDWGNKYYPSEVTLIDGTVIDRVYVAPTGTWGLQHIEQDPQYVPIAQVSSIRESPNRLALKLANKLYKSGETGMGYLLFGIRTRLGSVIPCATGDSVDFIKLPGQVQLADIVDVIPHWGKDISGKSIWQTSDFRAEQADFKWCLY
jgi:hypothetical protein